MHLDLTDEQAATVAESLRFSRTISARFVKSGKGNAEKTRWATERIAHIDAVLKMLDRTAR